MIFIKKSGVLDRLTLVLGFVLPLAFLNRQRLMEGKGPRPRRIRDIR